jgi:phenylalanyl-tRNA synthetase beta chain
MEYSLQHLNKIANLNNLKIQTLIDKLNLIGLEVEELFQEKIEINKFVNNDRLLISIPSNREDLLNENFFINELSTIFQFEIHDFWKKIKNNYDFLLKKKYDNYHSYETKLINSPFNELITYCFKIKKLKNTKTPNWIKQKLANSSIVENKSLLVNLINLSVFEWGQNINILTNANNDSFKIEQLLKPEIFFINENEPITLSKGTIVLKTNKNKILSALGVININTLENSSECYLEATFYDIQNNILELTTINTNLSYRYLRRVFLENFKFTFQRLLTLIELVGNQKITPIKYINQTKNSEVKTTKIISVRKNSAQHVLNLPKYELNIFKQAGFKLAAETNKELYFLIPNSRRDLTREIDLIEEYSRFIGYKNFTEILPKKDLIFYRDKEKSLKLIKQFFLNYGFNEVMTNSIYNDQKMEFETIKLINPLNNELSVLRTSLIPGLINVFETNLKSSINNQKFFEMGRTFKQFKNKIVEQDKIAGIFYFDFQKIFKQETIEWFKVKGFLEILLQIFGYNNLEFQKINKNLKLYHPTRSVIIKSNDIILGVFGELNPKFDQFKELKKRVYIFELNLDLLKNWRANSKIINYENFSKYPIISKDISISLSNDISLKQVTNIIEKTTINLKNIQYFDIYFDEKHMNRFNLGIRLIFQSKIETLKTENIEKQIENILYLLQKELNVKIS